MASTQFSLQLLALAVLAVATAAAAPSDDCAHLSAVSSAFTVTLDFALVAGWPAPA